MLDLPLVTYVATMSVTPGPNNLMLAASGVNFGFRRTLPHMLGVSVGGGLLTAMVAGAMAWVMTWMDALRLPLVIAGCLYLLWLAWRQAHAGRPGAGASAKPLGFAGAVLFQWVNPKAWMMVLNIAILFMPRDGGWEGALTLGAWCVCVNLPCIAVWAFVGDRMQSWLRSPAVLQVFNLVMATLLAGTSIWIAFDELHLA